MGLFDRLKHRAEPEGSSLKYKTRGASVPQGKSNVFFAAHPEDFPLFFDIITDEILALQNCVIWYKDPEQDRLIPSEDLEQMQLFVIPVTTRFLSQDNEAKNMVLPFAVEHQKPVLPILMESGIGPKFTESCRSLHAIGFADIDPTEKPFRQRLEGFLMSVLAGEELAMKIRSAFDTYIFMSYRKKDRAFAQALMKLIHSNESCRDVAIWYDEFLVPGEDFNDRIREALEKSPLFALVVTPSVLELNAEGKKNYVQEKEVPMAAEQHKVILPFVMKPVNQKQFKAGFSVINDVPLIDSSDPAAVSKTLEDALHHISWTPQEKDPQHTFFIGLAYLEGIDVEPDPEKALGLIRKAADEGLPEAAQKLALMYRFGQGVERDASASIRFQRQYVDLLNENVTVEPSREDLEQYYASIADLSVLLTEVHQLDEAAYNWIRLIDECAHEQRYPDLTYAVTFEANDKIGQIRREQCEYDQSLEYLQRNITSAEAGRKPWQTEEQYLTDRIFAYNDCGRTLLKVYQATKTSRTSTSDQAVKAKDFFTKGLAAATELDEHDPTVRHRQFRSASLSYLGNACDSLGDHESAMDCYLKMKSINKEMMETLRSAESRRNYAVSCWKVGCKYMDMGNMQEALKTLKEGLDEAKTVADSCGTWEDHNTLNNFAGQIMSILSNLGEDAAVEEYARIALESAHGMEKTDPCYEARLRTRDAMIVLEENLRCAGKNKEASTLAKEQLLLAENITDQQSTQENRHTLALCNLIMSFFPDRASYTYAKKAYIIWDALCRETSEAQKYQQYLETAAQRIVEIQNGRL